MADVARSSPLQGQNGGSATAPKAPASTHSDTDLAQTLAATSLSPKQQATSTQSAAAPPPPAQGSTNPQPRLASSAADDSISPEASLAAYQTLRAELGWCQMTLSALKDHANRLLAQGDNSQAISVLHDALKHILITCTSDSPLAPQVSYMLGLAYAKQPAVALKHFRWAAPRMAKHYGADSVAHSQCLQSASSCLVTLHQYADAAPPLQQAVAILQQKLGPYHHRTVKAVEALLWLHFAPPVDLPPQPALAQQYLTHYQQLSSSSQDPAEQEHCDFHAMICLEMLAQSHLAAEDDKAALKLLPQLSAVSKRLLGADHHVHLKHMEMRALSLRHTGKFAQAISLFTSIVHTLKTKHGLGHPNTLHMAQQLGVCYQSAGRHADALQVLKTAWKSAKGALDPNSHVCISLYCNLLNAARQVGGQKACDKILKQALARGLEVEKWQSFVTSEAQPGFRMTVLPDV